MADQQWGTYGTGTVGLVPIGGQAGRWRTYRRLDTIMGQPLGGGKTTVTHTAPTFPKIVVEVAFQTDPRAAARWTVVTDDVAEIHIRRGRDSELDEFTAGTAEVRFVDKTRDYDPTYRASPHWPHIRPNRRIRIRSVYRHKKPYSRRLFAGYIDGWETRYNPADRYSEVTVTASDAFKLLANEPIRVADPFTIGDATLGVIAGTGRIDGAVTFARQRSGARVDAVLDIIGWPNGLRNIDGGVSVIQADTPSGAVLDYLKELEAAEYGALFVTRRGRVAFVDRRRWIHEVGPTDPECTFSDDPDLPAGSYHYSQIEVDTASDRRLRNDVQRAVRGGRTYSRRDRTSGDQYGRYTDERTDLLLDDASEALDQAALHLDRYRIPRYRVERLTVNPSTNPQKLFPLIARLEIGDIVAVRRRPLDIGGRIRQRCRIEGVEHMIRPLSWETTLSVSLADNVAYFRIGDARFGVVEDDSYPLAY